PVARCHSVYCEGSQEMADRTTLLSVDKVIQSVEALWGQGELNPSSVSSIVRAFLDGPHAFPDSLPDALPEGGQLIEPVFQAPDGNGCVLIVRLGPGARMAPHDHGSWAVIGVCSGKEQETWYRRVTGDAGLDAVRLKPERRLIHSPGAVIHTPEGIIHEVQPLGSEPTTSIHVYGVDLVTRRRSIFRI